MLFLTPRHVKQGRAYIKDAKKLLAYKRDLWGATTVNEFENGIAELELAVRAADRQRIEESAQKLDQQAASNIKPVADAGWRENCEVFLVAIVIALGVRTYFLQPFTIPTGSMWPTLNGILGFRTESQPPNILFRAFQTAAFGRTWVNTVAKSDETVVSMAEIQRGFVFTYTKVITDRNEYLIHTPMRTLMETFGCQPPDPRTGREGSSYRAGAPIARGYVETGDHVFVDKFSYNFCKPSRGDVFVFNTHGIPTRENVDTQMQGPSQYYIKRLAGLPNDILQIRSPELFVNGTRAKGAAFERVMSCEHNYRGYSNPPVFQAQWLTSPQETFQLPEKSYFALGDNSYQSSDSRYWGIVPQQNIMGRGILVYWPFTRHWGLIK